MKKITVNLGRESYPIVIGYNILNLLPRYLKSLGLPREIFIITNSRIQKHYAKEISRSLKSSGFLCKFYLTIDSEKAKSINNAVRIVDNLASYAKQKKITILALGGGVIGDLSGFLSSIYKRGVPLVQVPTTLLAQIDSSIGGKTAIDLRMAKNLIGTFYQPKLVFCDLGVLKTLDKRQVRAGLSEALKYAAIKDERLFNFLEQNYHSVFSGDRQTLEHLVYSCARIKAGIVALDEKEEKGLRTILNFGHTIGHAIEAAGGYSRYNHGEAIALGMLAASRMSENLGLLSSSACQRISALIASLGLPLEISGIRQEDVLAAYRLDKKFIGRLNRFVLLKGIGRAVVYENVPEKIICNAVSELFVS